MTFDPAEFTTEAASLVAENDRVPAQRRWVEHPMDAETLAMIADLKAAHPVDRCDLFRTATGRCTCGSVGGE